jgi:hypothetical protein
MAMAMAAAEAVRSCLMPALVTPASPVAAARSVAAAAAAAASYGYMMRRRLGRYMCAGRPVVMIERVIE